MGAIARFAKRKTELKHIWNTHDREDAVRARNCRVSRALRSMEYSEARRQQASRAAIRFSGLRHFSTAMESERLSPGGVMSPWTPGVRISEKTICGRCDHR